MTLRTLFLAALTAIACALLVTPSTVYGQAHHTSAVPPLESEAEIALLIRQFEAHAAANGVEIEDVEVSRNIESRGDSGAQGDVGTMSASCTATATVGIPGGTKVELSATAPTCIEAIEMLADVVADFMEP